MVLVFYISSHGFGHAARAIELMNAIARLRPDVTIVIRSGVSPAFIAATAEPPVDLQFAETDTGVVQVDSLEPDEQYTMFHPSEVELSETTQRILADIERIRPARLVFDSLSELRLLAGNPLRYRRQILALKHYFSGQRCTVLLLDDLTGEAVCAFVVLKRSRPTGEEAKKIANELRNWVAKEIGPIAKPKDIRFGDNLPKTRSGKIMRRLLRSVAKGEAITQDTSTLENPAILEQLAERN